MGPRKVVGGVFFILALLLAVLAASPVHAEERLCDASVENCRIPLISLINNETVGIDVGVWFFKDDRYVTALVNAWNRGVPIRILMDPRANTSYPANATALDKLANAGIPMRKRIAGDILHWKLMLFAGQGVIEWSGANFSPTAFVPNIPYQDYEDEVIYFSHALLPSFMTKFDDIWTNTTDYANYANVTAPLVRSYDRFPIDVRLNFPPANSYQDRLVPLIDAEPKGGLIDVDMYRITMARPVDALIRAAARGVRQRLYLEPNEYANTARPGNKVQMDRLVAAAKTYPGTIEIRMRAHAGLNHQKTVWLHSQRIVIFGTSNWSDASDDNQLEANIFTDPHVADALNELLFTRLLDIFERKFYNEAPDGSIETSAWRTPSLPRPVLSTTCDDPTATNFGGPLPCEYQPPPPPDPNAKDIVIWAANTPASGLHGTWQRVADSTAAGGNALANPNAGAAKISPALASPANYVETTFSASAGTPYHLWVRMRAAGDSLGNDSIHVQFNDSVTSSGTQTMRIGSTSSSEIILQDGSTDSGVHAWGWADANWNGPAPDVYFATTGTHTLRIQQREDGAIVDQIVLSPSTYLTAPPGARDDDTTILPADGSTPPPSSLPAPWETSDVGAVGLAGGATQTSGSFAVSGAGADIWGTADAFRFVYQALAGDGTIVARVASVQNVNAWTKAGVMIRQGLAANAPHVSMFVTPAKGLAFQRRTAAGATSLNTSVAGAAPQWVRLTRAGDTFTASVSSDGSSWTVVGQETVVMSGSVYVGLAITSHDATRLASATIDAVTVP